MSTDIRIINYITLELEQGVDVAVGETIKGRIPERGQFYDGAERGMLDFEHAVSAVDLRAAVAGMGKGRDVLTGARGE